MKIGFVPAAPFFLIYGGGETQLIHPYQILCERGVDVVQVDYFDKEIKYDVLHFFGLHYGNYRFMSMAKKAGIKIVLEPISYATKKQKLGKAFHALNKFIKLPTTQHLHSEMLLLADYVIPNSYEELSYLKNYFGVSLKNTRIAYNAISEDFFENVGDEFYQSYRLKDYILCVG